jgi:hypothetical protein
MNLKKLNTLKEKIVGAENLNEPWEYFFSNFGDNPDFLNFGSRADNFVLETVIEKIGEKLLQQDVTVSNLLLTEIPEYQFIHGACFIHGRLMSIIFFRDIDMGLLSIVRSMNSFEISIVRFSSIQIKTDENVFLHNPRSDINH